MSGKTLVDYIDKLKPIQQEFIVFCVVEYGNRPDFHRGLLPFLKASEATFCLKTHLERLGEIKDGKPDYPGIRFIRQTMSVFADHYSHRLYEDEVQVIMQLKSAKLKKMVGPFRWSGKLVIRLLRYTYVSEDRLAELQLVSRDTWRVTTHKDDSNLVTLWLSDVCG